MKTKILLYVLIMSCVPLSYLHAYMVSLDYEPVAICLGAITFPSYVTPYANLYYNGKKLSIDVDTKEKSVAIIPYCLEEAKSQQQFHIVICGECKISSKENTIECLYVPLDVSYKFYTLSATREYNQDQEVDGYSWKVTENNLVDNNTIPQDAIIFLFDADLVEGLYVKSWPQNSNVRILPEIVIKKTASQKELVQAMNASAAASMDINGIHKRNMTCIKQIDQKAVLSLKS